MGRHFARHHITGEVADIDYRKSPFPNGWRVLWGDRVLGDAYKSRSGSWDVHGRDFTGSFFTDEGFSSRVNAAFHLVRRSGVWCTSPSKPDESAPCLHSDVAATTDLFHGPDAMLRIGKFLDSASDRLDRTEALFLAQALLIRLATEQRTETEANDDAHRAALGAQVQSLRTRWQAEAAAATSPGPAT